MRTTSATDAPTISEVRRRGTGHVVGDVVRRFIRADGSSHTRALGYQGMFAMLSGFIGLVGLASVLGVGTFRDTIIEFSKSVAPGPSGQLLQEAARQSTGGGTAALVGLGAAMFSGMFAMAQIERSANRLAGRTEDRTGVGRFLVALGLAFTAGLLAAIGLAVLAGGDAIANGFGWTGTAKDVWFVLRWIVGIVAAAIGIYLLFRWAPARPLGDHRSVITGALVALVLWVAFTIALAVWFSVSSSSQTYGPLLSVIALLLWAGATSLALHLGMATTAELAGEAPSARRAATPDQVQSRDGERLSG